MAEPSEVEVVVAVSRHLAAAGLAPGASGNVSIRTGDGIRITPTGSRLGSLAVAQLSLVDREGTHLGGERPSKEWPLHAAIYAARADAGAIVHLHAPASVAVACLADLDASDAIPAYTAYRVMRIGRLPLVPYLPPGDPGLGDAAAASAATAGRGLLLANHGLVAWARTLDEAAGVAEEIEAAADLHLRLRGLPVRLLTTTERDELERRFGS
jgi:ribulose-5-phosphate 4-epimerase/fuculose-1-phosphate aldolase